MATVGALHHWARSERITTLSHFEKLVNSAKERTIQAYVIIYINEILYNQSLLSDRDTESVLV